MIRRTYIALNGEKVVRLLPENEADQRELDELYRRGLLDRRFSFGDEPNPRTDKEEEEDAG